MDSIAVFMMHLHATRDGTMSVRRSLNILKMACRLRLNCLPGCKQQSSRLPGHLFGALP